jgi:recombination protein RecT
MANAEQMSGEMTVREKITEIGEFMRGKPFVRELEAALPEGTVAAQRIIRVVLSEIRKMPALASCTRESLYGCVLACAQFGLEPGPGGYAWMIPYKQTATFQLGYKGLYQLAYRSGQVEAIQMRTVFEGDDFDYSLGTENFIHHKPLELDEDAEEPPWTHVYATMRIRGGSTIFEVMSKNAIIRHRDRYSKAWRMKGEKSPWGTEEQPMAMKTAGIKVAKVAPTSAECLRAIALDERGERGMRQEIEINPADFKDEDLMDPEKKGEGVEDADFHDLPEGEQGAEEMPPGSSYDEQQDSQ